MRVKRKHGLPMSDRLARLSSPEPNTGCWLWTGALDSSGYGHIRVVRPRVAMVSAHRMSYETFVGPIPHGLVIDHRCCVRACINPDHLRAVTKAFNTLIGTSPAARHATKTHCMRGHPFDVENTIRYSGRNHRFCRTCIRERARAYRAGGRL